MLSKGFCLFLLFVSVATVRAHPGVGIVQDREGNVFFTDTKQVWKISPDGTQSVAMANVHTHELCLDQQDRLYGEHLLYEGDATKKWRHRVWRREPNGSTKDVIAVREGFLNDYSFVRDGAGSMYWADRGRETVIRKRLPDGMIVNHAAAGFRAVQRMTAMTDGTLFLMDGGSLKKISPRGEVSTVKARLSSHSEPPVAVVEMNYHMGLWSDRAGNVYVAVAGERLALRVDANGGITVVARSPVPWAPSGGMIDRDGNLWLLEYDSANAVRVRRTGQDGRERIFVPGATSR
jgi:hypothetical protein